MKLTPELSTVHWVLWRQLYHLGRPEQQRQQRHRRQQQQHLTEQQQRTER